MPQVHDDIEAEAAVSHRRLVEGKVEPREVVFNGMILLTRPQPNPWHDAGWLDTAAPGVHSQVQPDARKGGLNLTSDRSLARPWRAVEYDKDARHSAILAV